MSYTKEMCLFLLENKNLIEGDSLTEYVEKMVFKAINTSISKRLGERTPWRTRFALVTEALTDSHYKMQVTNTLSSDLVNDYRFYLFTDI